VKEGKSEKTCTVLEE